MALNKRAGLAEAVTMIQSTRRKQQLTQEAEGKLSFIECIEQLCMQKQSCVETYSIPV